VALWLNYEKKALSALRTARLNTDRFHTALLDHLRIVSGKRAVTVRAASFILHFSPSLKTGRAGKQARTEPHPKQP